MQHHRLPFLVFTFLLTALPIFLPGHGSAREEARENLRIPPDKLAPAHAWPSPLAARSLLLAVENTGDGLIAVGERGHILYRRHDGGQWEQSDVPTRTLLTGLSFSHARHGWAVGHDAIILATSDGGRTWRKAHEVREEERPLLDILFRNRQEGMAIGAYGYFLRTNDGGKTWHPGSVNPDHDFHLNAIAAGPGLSETGRIYIAAEAGYVYRSDDGGESWRTLKPPYDGSFFGVHPLDGDKVMVFGLRGRLFLSEDAGEHWRSVETGTRATLTSSIELESGQFLLTGHAGALLLADAGLETLHLAQLPARKAISDAVEIAPNRVLLVGEEGIRIVDLCRVFEEITCAVPDPT